MNPGLRGRLALSHLLVVSLTLGGLALWLPPAVERDEVAGLERQLAQQAVLLRRLSRPMMAASGRRGRELQALTQQMGGEIGARVTLIDARGRVLADTHHDPATMENHADRPEVREALRAGMGESERYSHTLGMHRLYVAVPVWDERPGPGRAPLGVVRLSLSLDEVQRHGERLRQALLLTLGAAALIAVGLSILFARTLTRPLRLLRDAALGLAQGDLTRRAPVKSQDEIGDLARAFDRMATRLDESIAALARDRGQMRAVFDTMADGLLVADPDARVRLLNPAAGVLLGVSAAGAAGKTVLDVTLDAPLQTMVDEVLRSGEAAYRERALRTPVERVVAVSAVPISAAGRGSGGPSPEARVAGSPESVSPARALPAGAVLVFHDLTAARRVERMRRDFVANASHELRTPLASMRLMVETLLGGAREDPEAAERFLQILDRELRRMTDLVNDLLALSRLDAYVEAALETVPLAPLVAELEAGWQAVANERGLRLAVAVADGLTVRAETQGMRQVLTNLVDNALKYTPTGEVRVTARWDGDRAVVEVADTGIGIPAADLDRVFERFYRVDKDRSRDIGGTGLGLSIVKHLVQAYGGSITVQSRLNRGSTFRVALPGAETADKVE